MGGEILMVTLIPLPLPQPLKQSEVQFNWTNPTWALQDEKKK